MRTLFWVILGVSNIYPILAWKFPSCPMVFHVGLFLSLAVQSKIILNQHVIAEQLLVQCQDILATGHGLGRAPGRRK